MKNILLEITYTSNGVYQYSETINGTIDSAFNVTLNDFIEHCRKDEILSRLANGELSGLLGNDSFFVRFVD